MPVIYQHIPDGASWVVEGAPTKAQALDARFDSDGSIWIFQQQGNGWAHYDSSLTLLGQGNFFGNTSTPAVMQHDEGIMLWGQDDAGHYFVRDTNTLYKLDSSLATVATLDLTTFSPTAFDGNMASTATEDMIVFKSGGVNYVAFCTTRTISPDLAHSAIIFVANADTMSVVGSYVDHPTSSSHWAWNVFGDKFGDIWLYAENDDTNGATLVQWHPPDGASGGTLNVTVHQISTAVLGFSFPFIGAAYDSGNHAIIIPTFGSGPCQNLSSVSLSTFTQLATRADDGSVADTNFVDGIQSATHAPGIKCSYGTTGATPANDFTYNGGVLQLVDPTTLTVTNTVSIAAGINATTPPDPWQTATDPNPAYPGAWLFNAGLGTMLAGYSNLAVSSAVFLVTGLPVFSACAPGPPPPTIHLNPTTLNFSATQGGSNPASQNVALTNTGGGTLNYTDSVDQSWLSVLPLSGSAPDTLVVSVDITGLTAGSYTGHVTVTDASATNSPQLVTVNLTVAPPPPSITLSSLLPFTNRVWQVGEDLVSRVAQNMTVTLVSATNWTLTSTNGYVTFNGKATLSGSGNATVSVAIADDANFPPGYGGRAKQGEYSDVVTGTSGVLTDTKDVSIHVGYSDFLDGRFQ